MVHKETCRLCNKFYLGCTQNYHKNRNSQHLGYVKRLVCKGKKSDSHAEHFAEHFKQLKAKCTIARVREMTEKEIIWQGDPIACVKSFGTKSCVLCMQERCAILKASNTCPDSLINSRNEIFGGCRHIPRFHRFLLNAGPNEASTDDGQGPEIESSDGQPRTFWWTNFTPDAVDDGASVCPEVECHM